MHHVWCCHNYMAHHCMTPKLTHWGIFVTLDKHAMLILVTHQIETWTHKRLACLVWCQIPAWPNCKMNMSSVGSTYDKQRLIGSGKVQFCQVIANEKHHTLKADPGNLARGSSCAPGQFLWTLMHADMRPHTLRTAELFIGPLPSAAVHT